MNCFKEHFGKYINVLVCYIQAHILLATKAINRIIGKHCLVPSRVVFRIISKSQILIIGLLEQKRFSRICKPSSKEHEFNYILKRNADISVQKYLTGC